METDLKKLNIVWSVLVFRERDLIKISFNYFINICNKIIVVMDNQDKETEEIVLDYKNRFPEIFVVNYSKYPRLEQVGLNKEHRQDKRFRYNEWNIRQQLIEFVKIEHEKKPIDLLFWFDADEVPTIEFPKILKFFCGTARYSLRTNYMEMFGDDYTFSNRTLFAHCRVFKYTPTMDALHWGIGKGFVYPFSKGTSIALGHFTVHMADHDIDYIKRRMVYKKRLFDNILLYRSEKKLFDLTREEFYTLLKGKPLCTAIEYYNNPEKYGYHTNS